MRKWRLRPRAQRDLNGIADYTARQWGRRQANIYLGQLDTAFGLLVADLWRGTIVRPDSPDVLKCHVGSHFIVFRRGNGHVDIIRILHDRMDIDEQLS